MQLYNSIGPNPQVVRMFLAEKGLTLPMVQIDLLAGENRRAPYKTDINKAGQTPALELDNGAILSEITVICEYLEDLHPNPVLIGATPEERAETRMWVRRIDLNIVEPALNGFRAAEGRPLFESRIKLVGATGAAELKEIAKDRTRWLGDLMGDNTYVCGDRFSLADIYLFVFIEFAASVGQPLAAEHPWVDRLIERVKARPSAKA